MLTANKFGSIYNYLPKGCKLCLKGAKMVLFITGKCNLNCWYCPISEERKGKDLIYANERPVKNLKDVLKEAKEMNALGASITGGEPLLKLNRTIFYIKFLKRKFGKNFHIHLYTYGNLINDKSLALLNKCGLDELRFHNFLPKKITIALNYNMNIGIEMPCIPWPNKEKYKAEVEKLKEIVDFCSENNIFLNLNEFEFSETNWEKMKKFGFERIGYSYAVKNSRKLAMKIANYAEKKKVKFNFCSVKTKFMLQLVERLKRRASIIKKPWQKINRYGYLVYAEIECDKKFAKRFGLYYNKKLKVAETSIEKAKELRKKFKLNAWKVTIFPSYKPWVFEKVKL
ncbi:MAG: radical SAM protein [Candidatus Pacearchaeota archaeon]